MSRTPEFHDTPADRSAAVILLEASGRAAPADLEALNAAWDDLAPRIAASDEETFNRWLDEVEAHRGRAAPEAMSRADDLIAHLIGWRLGDV